MKQMPSNGNRMIVFLSFIWKVRTFLLLSVIAISTASTAIYVISFDYLDHRKERATALDNAQKNIRGIEREFLQLLTKTSPLWKSGQPISKGLREELAAKTTELYSAIESLSNATTHMSKASSQFRHAVAKLRNSIISYRHNEKGVSDLHLAIEAYAKNRDEFHAVVEKQLEDYSKSVIGVL